MLYYECKKMLQKLIFICKVIEMCSRDLKVGVFGDEKLKIDVSQKRWGKKK